MVGAMGSDGGGGGGGTQKEKKGGITSFLWIFLAPSQKFVRQRTITKEHDLRAGNWEDGVGLL